MLKPFHNDPCDPQTRARMREVLDSFPDGGSPCIRVIVKAKHGITKEGQCLGVLPASFNPPTLAHTVLTQEAMNALRFDEFLLVLDKMAMDKKFIGAPLEDRLLMLLAIFGDYPQISLGVANRGLFLDKVEALQKLYPSETKIYFVVGFDTIVRVLDPKYYKDREQALQKLFSQARFLVANRGDCDQQNLKELFRKIANRAFAAQVIPFKVPSFVAWISSTLVRQKWAQGESVQELVPPQVEEFIKKRGFYYGHTSRNGLSFCL
jgi:nicotinate (nicotinamide) nucleotide adenylyltransferase